MEKEELLEKDINELDLSVRSYNCLTRRGIHTIKDLVRLSFRNLKMTRNLGSNSLDEIIRKVHDLGLKFVSEDSSIVDKDSLLQSDISLLAISPNEYYRLRQNNINTISELINTNTKEIEMISSFSEQTVDNLRKALSLVNLEFKSDKIRSQLNDILKYGGIIPNELLKEINILDIGLSTRPLNALRRAQIYNLEQIVALNFERLSKVRYLGTSSAEEIIDKVHSLGLYFEGEERKYVKNSNVNIGYLSLDELEQLSIDYMGLSSRSYNGLIKAGINTIGDVLKLNIPHLHALKSIGDNSTQEIVDKVHELGLFFRFEMTKGFIYSKEIYEGLQEQLETSEETLLDEDKPLTLKRTK